MWDISMYFVMVSKTGSSTLYLPCSQILYKKHDALLIFNFINLYYALYLLVRWWSCILEYQSLFTLNQAFGCKNMKSIIIRIDLNIKLQPCNCLFGLIWVEYEGNCIVSCTSLTWTWRPTFSYSFPDVPWVKRV